MKCLKAATDEVRRREARDTGAELPRICDRELGAGRAARAIGTRAAIELGMEQLVLTVDHALIEETAAPAAPVALDNEALMAMPLTDAKRLAAAEFERCYLVRVMERADGKVSEGARLSGLDRTNFRRLLHRHGLR